MVTLKQAQEAHKSLSDLIQSDKYYADTKLPSLSEIFNDLIKSENEQPSAYIDDYIS